MSNKFYLTTTLPYVNDNPHLGHALEFVEADVICRYRKSLGDDVFLNTGTDEHGLKIYRKALEAKEDPQSYTDRYAARFKDLLSVLGISYSRFIRTTDADHIAAAREFWLRCNGNGDIYKTVYKVKYCVGCELEKTESDLVDGKCPVHPNLSVEEIEEENYFFRFSKYQKPLLDLYAKFPDFVLPENRLKEIRNFVEGGLQDFSISRLKSKMPWGIPVPGDEDHVMYVWFDALINYVSTLGWPAEVEKFSDFWGSADRSNAMQIAGKDNLRQQSAMWQAMLLSAGLPASRRILIHGFITSNGQKMSKTLGNVIDPMEIIGIYGPEAFRFFMSHDVSIFEDSDLTKEKLKDSYNSHLANGLGNLVQRVMKMASSYGVEWQPGLQKMISNDSNFFSHMEKFELQNAISFIWATIGACDLKIQTKQPFKTVKTDPEKAKEDILDLLSDLWQIADLLKPFMPETSKKILASLESGQPPATPLFPRKD